MIRPSIKLISVPSRSTSSPSGFGYGRAVKALFFTTPRGPHTSTCKYAEDNRTDDRRLHCFFPPCCQAQKGKLIPFASKLGFNLAEILLRKFFNTPCNGVRSSSLMLTAALQYKA